MAGGVQVENLEPQKFCIAFLFLGNLEPIEKVCKTIFAMLLFGNQVRVVAQNVEPC